MKLFYKLGILGFAGTIGLVGLFSLAQYDQLLVHQGDIMSITNIPNRIEAGSNFKWFNHYPIYSGRNISFKATTPLTEKPQLLTKATRIIMFNPDTFPNARFPFVSNIIPQTNSLGVVSSVYVVDNDAGTYIGNRNVPRGQLSSQLCIEAVYRTIDIDNSTGKTNNVYFIEKQADTSSVIYNLPNNDNKLFTTDKILTGCDNYYIAYCGDGKVDQKAGDKVTDGQGGMIIDGTFLAWGLSPTTDEVCDDGGAAGGCKDDCTGTGDNPTGQLVVNKTVVGGTTNFAVGNDVQFRIDFNNQSNQTINNVKIEDILPAGLSYVNSQIYGVTNAIFSTGMSGSSLIISYTGFSLSSGQNGYILINTKMNICTASTNFAFREGGIWKGHSSAIADCQSTAELTFTKTMAKYNLVPGDTAIFTIRVSNNLSKVMSNVVVEDIWPSTNGCITMIPGTAVPATSNNTWSFGTLNPSDSKQITFNGKISNDSSCAGSYINTAKITYTTDGTNKTATAIARFIIESVNQNVSIIKTRIGDEPVGLGSDVIFEIEYTNIGDTDIVGFKVTDMLSPAFKYKTSSIRSGLNPVLYPNEYQNPLVWDFGSQTLKAKSTGKIRLTVKIK